MGQENDEAPLLELVHFLDGIQHSELSLFAESFIRITRHPQSKKSMALTSAMGQPSEVEYLSAASTISCHAACCFLCSLCRCRRVDVNQKNEDEESQEQRTTEQAHNRVDGPGGQDFGSA